MGARANDHGLYFTNVESFAKRAIDMYSGNRGRSMSGAGCQREAGSTAINSRLFSMLDFQREARPTKTTIDMYTRREGGAC